MGMIKKSVTIFFLFLCLIINFHCVIASNFQEKGYNNEIEAQKTVAFPFTKLPLELAFHVMTFLPSDDLRSFGSTSIVHQTLAENIFKGRHSLDEPVSLLIPPARQWKISYFLRNLMKEIDVFYRGRHIHEEPNKPCWFKKICGEYDYFLKEKTKGFFDFRGQSDNFIQLTAPSEKIQQCLNEIDYSDTFSRELLLHYFLKIWSIYFKEAFEDQLGSSNIVKFILHQTQGILSLLTFFAEKNHLKTVHYYTQRIPFHHLLSLSARLQAEQQYNAFYHQFHQRLIDLKFAQATTEKEKFDKDFEIYFLQVSSGQIPQPPRFFNLNEQSDTILRLERPEFIRNTDLGTYYKNKIFTKFKFFMATRLDEVSLEAQCSILKHVALYCVQISRCFISTPLICREDIHKTLAKVEASIFLLSCLHK